MNCLKLLIILLVMALVVADRRTESYPGDFCVVSGHPSPGAGLCSNCTPTLRGGWHPIQFKEPPRELKKEDEKKTWIIE